jgi:hypothetical protein
MEVEGAQVKGSVMEVEGAQVNKVQREPIETEQRPVTNVERIEANKVR